LCQRRLVHALIAAAIALVIGDVAEAFGWLED
jgi:hypothetical protein